MFLGLGMTGAMVSVVSIVVQRRLSREIDSANMRQSRQNRRRFMTAASAAFAGFAGAPSLALSARAAAAAEQSARRLAAVIRTSIVVNAKVYTMDARAPRAEAFAVTSGRFVAVGTSGDIKGLAGKRTQTFDAKGMTVVPGFIDCHNHAGGETLLNEVLVGNPFEVEFVTIRSIIDKLRAQGAADAAGHVGRGLLLRRHQAEGQARAEHSRPRRGVDGASGGRPPSRRPHLLLQQQGVRDGRHHEGHAQPDGRHVTTRTPTAS